MFKVQDQRGNTKIKMTPNANARIPPIAIFFFLLPPIFWAGNAVVARLGVVDSTPLMIALARWTVALLILLPIGLPRMRGQWGAVGRHWKVLLAQSFFSIACYNTILYYGLQTTTAINAMLVTTALPAMTAPIAWLWLGDRLGRAQILGIVIAFLGVLVIAVSGDLGALLRLELHKGDALTVLSTLTWAIYTVMVRRFPMPMDALAHLTLLVIAGEVMLIAAALVEAAIVPWPPVTTGLILSGLYLGVFPAVLAYYAWSRAIALVGPTITSLGVYLTPVFTAMLAIGFLDEDLRWHHLAGMALVMAGLYFTRPPRRVSQ